PITSRRSPATPITRRRTPSRSATLRRSSRRLRLLEHARRVPLDHVIRRRNVTDVLQAVELVRSLEDHRTGTGPVRLPVQERFDGPLLDDDQLLVRMLVRRVRALAGIQRRDVAFELVERRRRPLEEL